MVKLVQVVKNADQYHLREIVVNSAHIMTMVADPKAAGLHMMHNSFRE
jgi:hypothetical protein